MWGGNRVAMTSLLITLDALHVMLSYLGALGALPSGFTRVVGDCIIQHWHLTKYPDLSLLRDWKWV